MSDVTQKSRTAGRKRRRAKDELRQDPNLWLSDGNVVLSAKDDHGITWGFKCHRSILSRHSEIFKGMFTVNQPEDAEMHEGLPLVALTDRYDDLRGLLHMLYDPVGFLPKPPDTADVEPCSAEKLRQISGPLLMAHKYNFELLQENLIDVLQSHWPTDLASWDKVSEKMRQLQDKDKGSLANPASVIALSNIADLKYILGAAYYDLHTRMRTPRIDYMEPYDVSQVTNLLRPFRPEHHVLFTQGCNHLRQEVVEVLRRGLPGWVPLLCDSDACNEHIQAWLNEQFLEHTATDIFLFDPLYALQIMQQSAEALEKLATSPICLGCRQELPALVNACRRFIWHQLPFFFGGNPEDWEYGAMDYDTFVEWAS